MNDFYQNTVQIPQSTAQDPPILLAPEQIIPQNRPQGIKNEQNIIIRLANSIKKYGILEPLSVKPASRSNGFPVYELIDGERRYRAAAIAGIGKLPCTVLPFSDPKCLQMAEITRLSQEKLHFFALAEALLRLVNEYHMTQEEIARRMCLSQSAVANKLRLLKFTSEERRLIVSGELTERHARAFLRLSDPVQRATAITIVQRDRLNVAETEALISHYLKKEADSDPAKPSKPAAIPKDTASESLNCTFAMPTVLQNAPASSLQEQTEGQAPQHRKSGFDAPKIALGARASGVTPRKFALHDLQPLYNSIERTLGIFQKTGVAAEYRKEEDEDAARIVIYIPKRG